MPASSKLRSMFPASNATKITSIRLVCQTPQCARAATGFAPRGRKFSRLVVPEVNAKEAAMVSGIAVYPVKSFIDVVHFINSGNGILPIAIDQEGLLNEAQHFAVDFKDVRGQQTAKRALEVAS